MRSLGDPGPGDIVRGVHADQLNLLIVVGVLYRMMAIHELTRGCAISGLAEGAGILHRFWDTGLGQRIERLWKSPVACLWQPLVG